MKKRRYIGDKQEKREGESRRKRAKEREVGDKQKGEGEGGREKGENRGRREEERVDRKEGRRFQQLNSGVNK